MERELAALVGAEHVLQPPATAPYNSDCSRRRGIVGRADAVVLPASAEEVAAVMGWCYKHDVPLIARGGGTGLTGGAVPSEGGVVCSLERLRAVRELDAGLWRMCAEAGVSTRDVQRLALENGLRFAPDPGAAEQSQIGGNVATNAGGPHALKYGVTGAYVRGLEVVLAPGEVVSLGGWARKDVAGYDLQSLLVGSEGTLGVVTSVRLALVPAPEAARALVCFLRSRADGCAAILDVQASGVQPAALELIDGGTLEIVAGGYPGTPPEGAGCALIVEVDGAAAAVAAEREALEEVLAGAAMRIEEPADAAALWRWRDGFNGVVTAARGGKVSEDVAVPVERLGELLERFEEIATRAGLRSCAWGHGGDGNVHATVLVDPAQERELDAAEACEGELFELVASLGGSVAAEHGVGSLKRARVALQLGERERELAQEIKGVFDPKGLLNPGKKLAPPSHEATADPRRGAAR
jgi:glycolate oxidase subunit GlcD